MGHQVYTDPSVEGAPQPGDIVVVVHDDPSNDGFFDGHMAALVRSDDADTTLVWLAAMEKGAVPFKWWVYGVRWPTPAELLQYQLSPDGRVTVEP